jgi:hypothetical protein
VVNGAQSPTNDCREIRIKGDGNRVTASHIGTDVPGGAAVSTACTGVEIAGDRNVIGGTATERNVIRDFYGVRVDSGKSNEITGNRLGTDAGGTAGLAGQGRHGVYIMEADTNIVRSNLISDWVVGVYVTGDENVIDSTRSGRTSPAPARSATPRAS